ncbi:MAG: hypothetical protein QOC92_1029 [Acidimicrobiaceae bacterium]
MTRRLLVTCVVFALVLLTSLPAAVAEPAPDISPELDQLPVDGLEYRVAQSRFDDATAALSTTQAPVASSAAELTQLEREDVRLTAELATETARKKEATVTMVKARAGLRALAIDSYVRGQDTLIATEDLNGVTLVMANRTLRQAVSDEQTNKRQAAADALRGAVRTITADLEARANTRQRRVVVQATHDDAVVDAERLTQALARRQEELDRARVMANVVGEDFALVALDAYWKAANAMAAEDPKCGISWWALAGITRSESRHGTYGGARLLANGDVDRIIIGIPLDGANDTALISDTDGGALDGDPEYDRAVGPMQFIPSTWRRWARDGNGDRRSSPNNIYDAALAAAHYLCASGPMQTDDQLRRGFLSYNQSDAYATAVLNYAKIYALFRIPSRR